MGQQHAEPAAVVADVREVAVAEDELQPVAREGKEAVAAALVAEVDVVVAANAVDLPGLNLLLP